MQPLHRVFHFAGGFVQVLGLDREAFPLVEAHRADVLSVRFQCQRVPIQGDCSSSIPRG